MTGAATAAQPRPASFAAMYERLEAKAMVEGPRGVTTLRTLEAQYALARQLVSRRRQFGMTQQQLALASNRRQSEISRIERGNGNPTLKTLCALAGALDMRMCLAAGGRPRR